LTVNTFIDPANLDSLKGLFRVVKEQILKETNGMLPCRVLAFNRGNPNRVQVEHVINQIGEGGVVSPRGQIASIPVLQLGGGGFVINFNIQPGDLGWIEASDRDISLFLQSYNTSSPNTYRKFNFADARFIPDVMHGYTIAGEDTNNLVIQSLDGTVKISLGADKIKIAAPTVEIDSTTEVIINSPTVNITTTGDVDINAMGTTNLTSPTVNVISSTGMNVTTPTFAVTGDITATGTITPGV